MAKSKNKNKKSAPKAKLQTRNPGESLWDFFMRQLEAKEAELREIEARKAEKGDKFSFKKEEEIITDDENFDKCHAQAILFASLGVNSEVMKTVKKAKGKIKNISEASKANIWEYYNNYEDYVTPTEKGYIESIKASNKNVNTALSEVNFIVNRYKIAQASEALENSVSEEIMKKAEAIYNAFRELVKKISFTLYMEADDIGLSFDLRYNSDYTQMQKDIITMLALGLTKGGEVLFSTSEPAYKEERERQYFTFFTLGDGEIKNVEPSVNQERYIDFHDGEELSDKVDYIFKPFTELLADFEIAL